MILVMVLALKIAATSADGNLWPAFKHTELLSTCLRMLKCRQLMLILLFVPHKLLEQ
jgi:hypothetical protein